MQLAAAHRRALESYLQGSCGDQGESVTDIKVGIRMYKLRLGD